MKRHLKQFVKCELFPGQTPPPITNRRFYPTDVDVRNHMYRASVKKLLSKVDQENLSYCRNRKWNRWDLWADWRTPLCTSNSLAETSYESLWKWNIPPWCNLRLQLMWVADKSILIHLLTTRANCIFFLAIFPLLKTYFRD